VRSGTAWPGSFNSHNFIFIFSYWNSGEPNGLKNENCGQIKNYNSKNSWNDEKCSILHSWMCEKKASP
uniref:C-type lectin domain-containing protein n=1 Tax=Pundamilia nyererei TaxID=303518 RepID=A0A3B4GPB7_9CICH